jgi:hypothetical protein
MNNNFMAPSVAVVLIAVISLFISCNGIYYLSLEKIFTYGDHILKQHQRKFEPATIYVSEMPTSIGIDPKTNSSGIKSDPVDSLRLVGAIIAVIGAVATAFTLLIESIRDWIIKRREEYVDISKYKIDSISKSRPNLIKQASYYNAIHAQLTDNDTNPELCFFYMCNILMLNKIFFETYGQIQFDNRLAEDTIGAIGDKILSSLDESLGLESSARMETLARLELSYDEFKRVIIPTNDNLYKKFSTWLYVTKSSDDMIKSCKTYAELIMLELNIIYQIWYKKQKPSYIFLSKDVRNYLAESYDLYYSRIYSMAGKWFG